MTRWELLKKFHEIAQILFIENPAEPEETLVRLKAIVFSVLTEVQTEEPLVFDDQQKMDLVNPKKGA